MEENNEELIELEGFITFYKFENEDNSYRVASFKIDDNKQERTITIVGYFPKYNKQDSLILKGRLIHHKKFGLQVEVVEINKKLPTSKENIIRFLSSSTFKGVGKKCATAIYDYLLDETIYRLINDTNVYDELLANKIIKESQIDSLKNGLRNFDFKSNAYQKLIQYGFSMKNIMKAEAIYGEDLDKIISNNPYQMILDIDGVGFKSVDKIAMSYGIEPSDPRRVKAAILYCLLNLCHRTGDTYTSSYEIYKDLNKIIKIDLDEFNKLLKDLENDYLIIHEDDKYFHRDLYNAEKNIVKDLMPFIYRRLNKKALDLHFEEMLKQIEEDEGITYSDEQVEAIYKAVSSGLFIITGGPGTGKTTILNAILKFLKMLYGENSSISLCAPTGRASKRMSLLSNHYACTIHRLLKWDLHSNAFAYNANNKLHTDVIIIDEFSMVDTLLFEALLEGTIDVSQIILIGDDGQIPSVGAGNLLHDLLDIEKINHLTLSHIYRQSLESSIISLAYKVRYNELDESFKFNKDVNFFKINNVDAANVIVNLLQRFFDNGYSFDDIQVIVPMYGNVAGIDNINAAIQAWYNPKKEDTIEVMVNHQVFRIGDRVLQLKNQPEDDIFNGDIGVITDIDLDNEEIVVEFDVGEVIYPKTMYSNLTLAYAISIHKSQGSEFKYVIMTVFKDYGYFLNKQLLYTGITRAKDALIMLGDYKTFLIRSHEENKISRKTDLVNKFYQLSKN